MEDSSLVKAIRDRHARVLESISSAVQRTGRSPGAVRLVVVTKAQPLGVVQAAIDAGARILGENYAEEAVSKMRMLRDVPEASAPGSNTQSAPTAAPGVEWHMIGHVQGRKAQLVAGNFDMVHSVDSVKLAQRLDRSARELGRELTVLLEFNVGGESAKQGWMAQNTSEWPALLDDIGAIADLPNLKVRGLMTMPPLSDSPEDSRMYFRKLRELQSFLAARLPDADWRELSMGTSIDYIVAVEEGATLVRVGEAILGSRTAREAA